MSITLTVEKQRFEFGAGWSFAFKYDETGFYRESASKLQGDIDEKPHSTKAVDLVCFHETMGLLFLEAKDFRGHRIVNKNRIQSNEVSLEAAVKVRDTVAALLGAARKNITEFQATDMVKALEAGKQVTVVLWLEDDTFRNEQEMKRRLGTLTQVLKSKLSWLNVKALVLSSKVPNSIQGLRVSNLQGAGQAGF